MVLFQGQFEAWITLDRLDGAKREEYAVEVDEQRKLVTCWIASEVGKTFQVCWKSLTPTSFHCHGELLLDGHWVSGITCPAHDNVSTIVHHNYLTSSTTARPFMFSSLELTDDDVYLSTSYSQDIGEIRLTLNQVKLGEMMVSCRHLNLPPMDRKIHERSKKMMAHRVGFGEEMMTSTLTTWQNADYIGTLVTFVFKYRNLSILKANGVVQSSPDPLLQAPEPPRRAPKRPIEQEDCQSSEEDGDDDDDDDDDEEEKALLVKLAEVRARRGKRDPQRPRKKVKKEDTPIEINFNNLPGGIIDLT